MSALVPAAGLAYLLTAAWAQDVPRPEGPPDRPPAERPERDAPRDVERPRVEMERVEIEGREIEERLAEIRPAGAERRIEAVRRQAEARPRAEADERIAALQRKLAELPPEAQERERIKDEMAALRRERAAEGDRPARPEELRALVRKLQQLRRQSAELRESGRLDAAEQVLAKARELERQLRKIAPDLRLPEPDVFSQPGPGPEIESLQRRVEHLAIAVENLHAAGLHEPAEKLTGEIEGNRRELEHLIRERRPGAEMGPRFAEMAEMVHGLRAEVAELREVVGKLHARLDEFERRAPAPPR